MSAPRIAIAGVGHHGSRHADKLQHLAAAGEVEIAGVADPNPDARGQVLEGHEMPRVATLAELGTFDAALIASPTSEHCRIALEALERGADVMIEKPLASNLTEARRVVEAAREAGRLVQVGHVERFNPALRAALPLAAGAGYVVTERLGPFTGRSASDDVLLDLMIHDLDLLSVLFDGEVSEVRAVGVPVLTREVDMASVRLELSSGAVAQLSAGRTSLEPSRKIRIFTPHRYLSVDCIAREVKSVRRVDTGEQWPQISGESVNVADEDALLEQLRSFVSCVRERKTPEVSGEDGVRVLGLVERIRKELRVPFGT